MTFAPLGDSAVVVTLGDDVDESTLVRVRSLAAMLESEVMTGNGIVEVVAAYTTVTVIYEFGGAGAGNASPYDRMCELITACAKKAEHAWPDLLAANLEGAASREERKRIEVPVCYGGEFGPDLPAVAQHCGLTLDEVIELHSEADYVVHAVGFTPGFPYLGGLPAKLRTPRRPTPRVSVPAGSVGIGWTQTGIYPLASPGGWQLIGRTPLTMFDVRRKPPARLRVGDRLKFRPLTPEEFAAWK